MSDMVCAHGQLSRQCELCEALNDNETLRREGLEALIEWADTEAKLEATIADLTATVERLRGEFARAEKPREALQAELIMLTRAEQAEAERDALRQQLAVAQAERDVAEFALRHHGYRKSCDIPACNCGDQWFHGGNARERLSEFADALRDADVETCGVTLLQALSSLVDERDAAQADAGRLKVLEQALLHGDECHARFCLEPEDRACDADCKHPHFEVYGWNFTREAVGQSLSKAIDDIAAAMQEPQP